jgi:hypothetical protein
LPATIPLAGHHSCLHGGVHSLRGLPLAGHHSCLHGGVHSLRGLQ